MRIPSSSIPSSPKLNAELWLVAFAIPTFFTYLIQGYQWPEAIASGLVVATVYVGSRILIVYVLKRSENRKEREREANSNL